MGRRGGSSGLSDIDDGWDADPMIKAQMAFDIIWLIVTAYQFTLIGKVIHLLPPIAKGRYHLLLWAAIFLFVGYLFEAVSLRAMYNISIKGYLALNYTSSIFYGASQILLPAAALYMLHLRAQFGINTPQQGGVPWPGQFWKRCFDWAIVAFFLIFLIAGIAIAATSINVFSGYQYIADITQGFYYFRLSLFIIFVGNVVASSIGLNSAFKRRNGGVVDPVTNGITKVVAPALAVYALLLFIFVIISGTDTIGQIDSLAFGLAQVIIFGVLTAIIIWGLYRIALLPNAWSKAEDLPPVYPGIGEAPVKESPKNETPPSNHQPLTYSPPNPQQQQGWGQYHTTTHVVQYPQQTQIYQPPPGPPQPWQQAQV